MTKLPIGRELVIPAAILLMVLKQEIERDLRKAVELHGGGDHIDRTKNHLVKIWYPSLGRYGYHWVRNEASPSIIADTAAHPHVFFEVNPSTTSQSSLRAAARQARREKSENWKNEPNVDWGSMNHDEEVVATTRIYPALRSALGELYPGVQLAEEQRLGTGGWLGGKATVSLQLRPQNLNLNGATQLGALIAILAEQDCTVATQPFDLRKPELASRYGKESRGIILAGHSFSRGDWSDHGKLNDFWLELQKESPKVPNKHNPDEMVSCFGGFSPIYLGNSGRPDGIILVQDDNEAKWDGGFIGAQSELLHDTAERHGIRIDWNRSGLCGTKVNAPYHEWKEDDDKETGEQGRWVDGVHKGHWEDYSKTYAYNPAIHDNDVGFLDPVSKRDVLIAQNKVRAARRSAMKKALRLVLRTAGVIGG